MATITNLKQLMSALEEAYDEGIPASAINITAIRLASYARHGYIGFEILENNLYIYALESN